jgi:hypothetical protein
MGDKRNSYKILVGKPERGHLSNIEVLFTNVSKVMDWIPVEVMDIWEYRQRLEYQSRL